jgi:hypothetical protein
VERLPWKLTERVNEFHRLVANGVLYLHLSRVFSLEQR